MKPIIMSTEDIRGILDERKTMQRMPMKPQPVRNGAFWELGGAGWSMDTVTPVYGHSLYNRMPHKPGDVLYVRETWARFECAMGIGYIYRADEGVDRALLYCRPDRWRSPVTMPREAARLFLRVTDVRVEQVQDISAEDCEAEGYFETAHVEPRPRSWFSTAWDARNAKSGYGWDTNPWVWVYSFKRVDKPAGWPGGEDGE